jgi:hypothetical protein
MINGNHVENPSHIAEAFNNFFVNIGQVLDKNIPTTSSVPTQFIPKNYTINIFLNPTTDLEITKIISNLKDCATGWDKIPSSILKDSKAILSPILAHIINNSLLTGIFPSELKIANVIPIFKSGNLEEINNYRPVSLLTIMSKIYEKVFYTRLINFLNDQIFFMFKDKRFALSQSDKSGSSLLIFLSKSWSELPVAIRLLSSAYRTGKRFWKISPKSFI